MKIKYFIVFLFAIMIVSSSVLAADEYAEAKQLIQSKISCDTLTDSQLEKIGDYYMEQMHPGEFHKIMEARLGGEGSETLRLAHINMGKMFYCGVSGTGSSGMMNTMMGRRQNNFVGGMMYGSYYQEPAFLTVMQIIVAILFIAVLFLALIWFARHLRSTKHNGKENKKR